MTLRADVGPETNAIPNQGGPDHVSPGQSLDNLVHLDPRRTGGDFSSVELEAQRQALAAVAVGMPHVEVVRRTPIGEPERVSHSTVYQESVRFSDGSVRKATYVDPDKPATKVLTVSADPFITGDEGFNRTEIEQSAEANLPVLWVHHQSKHRVLPVNVERARTLVNISRSKGTARAAAQEVAAARSYLGVKTLKGVSVMRRGYSRSAQSGSPFIVMTEAEGGHVPMSVLEAEVFPHPIGWLEMGRDTVRQARAELTAISSIAASILGSSQEEDYDTERGDLKDYAGTASLHWLNILNEALWINKFRSGEAGRYAQAVRLGAQGIRLQYTLDEWGHLPAWLDINAPRPNIVTASIPGAHTSGATPEMRQHKGAICNNIANHAREHEGSLDEIKAYDILPKELRKYIVQKAAA
ncbi:MAG TPA: hypothetical protein VG604_04150 [Candidatus Saccharimonadales bacterium]|nr:hypothetical protein [Candidatus Saccharimonadales bacterium]